VGAPANQGRAREDHAAKPKAGGALRGRWRGGGAAAAAAVPIALGALLSVGGGSR